jgi:hypothetical protein
MKLLKINDIYSVRIDDEDFENMSKYKWQILKTKHCTYAKRHHNNSTVYMHIEIMKPNNGMQVDHKDGNGLNNQRSNLRICTQKQNKQNRSRQVNQINKYIGVSKIKNKWQARYWNNGKTIVIGRFDTEIEAATARNEEILKIRKEFAKLNEI